MGSYFHFGNRLRFAFIPFWLGFHKRFFENYVVCPRNGKTIANMLSFDLGFFIVDVTLYPLGKAAFQAAMSGNW